MRTTAIYTTAALILASFIGISCQKEMSETAEETPVTVIGTIDDSATKVSFSEDTDSAGNSVIKTAWEVGDIIIGWDGSGNKLVLEIADNGKISNGTAVFTRVSGTLPTAEGAKIYMIYAPGKTASDLTDKLTYDLSSQSGKVPALMTATGTLTGGRIALNFSKVLALVAVKNPKLDVSTATTVNGLTLSGSNVKSSVTIGKTLSTSFSGSGPITKSCSFTTSATGATSNVMVYFAVAPNSTSAQVTVSTVEPQNYEIIKTGANFVAGNCYVLDTKNVDKHKFTVTVQNGITNGTISTDPSGSAKWGSTVTITASPTNPSTDYELKSNSITVTKAKGGTVSLSGTGPYTFTMPEDNVTVSGEFQKKKYKLTSSVNDGNMGSVGLKYTGGTAIDSGSYIEWGSGVTVTPSANTYYEVEKITYGTTDITTAKTFNMPKANTNVDVTFRKCSYTISKGTETNGTFTVSATSSKWGETITVKASPSTNYIVDKMIYTDESDAEKTITFNASNEGTFTMPKKNTTVNVTFKLNKFAISKEDVSITGASFKVTKGGTEVSEATPGDVLKVDVTCPNGYKVDKITVCKKDSTSTTVEVGADGSFTMPAYAVTVKVELKLDESGSGTELTPGGLI